MQCSDKEVYLKILDKAIHPRRQYVAYWPELILYKSSAISYDVVRLNNNHFAWSWLPANWPLNVKLWKIIYTFYSYAISLFGLVKTMCSIVFKWGANVKVRNE